MGRKLVYLTVLVFAVAPVGALQGAAIAERPESFDADPGMELLEKRSAHCGLFLRETGPPRRRLPA